MSDLLVELHQSIVTEDYLKRLLGTREDLHLEFKEKADRRTPELDKNDAANFSKALSGFANSDGGVLLWGVSTDDDGRANGLHPISDVP